MYGFDYQRPSSRDAAKSAASGADARYLAGGQSLIQAMRLRLSQSERLVDLGGIADLKTIKVDSSGVTVGAMATHASVAANADVKKAIPALAELAGGIGDPMVRNMGTIGGSIANNDPAADWPAGVVGLNATVVTSKRKVAADEFFKGLYETALASDEIVTAVSFPVPKRAAYMKFHNPASRFALVGVFVAQLADGAVRVAVSGAAPTVFRCKPLEETLAKNFTADAARAAKLSANGLNRDLHGSPEYRAHLVGVLAGRAIEAMR